MSDSTCPSGDPLERSSGPSSGPSRDDSSPSGPLVAVARILGPHGRDGGLRVKATSDVPGRFDVGASLSASRDGITVLPGDDQTYQIVMSRPVLHRRNKELLLWFKGVRDREQAQRLAGLWLCVDQSEVPSAQEGEYFHYQLIGLRVKTVAGEDLGELSEILETGSNDVYVVTGPDGEILVPALSKVVSQIDIAAGLMVVDLPEGLR